MTVERRDFLRRAGLVGGAVLLGGPTLLSACSGNGGGRSRPAARPLIDVPAKESPIDTVVVVMMENRSFDHYLAWLTEDEAYLEAGRSRYGDDFRVEGDLRQQYQAPDGSTVETTSLLDLPDEPNVFRGCGHPDPGHGWDEGRVQRDAGFLADGSGNDAFAVGYYEADAIPFTAQLAREYTVFDGWHASVLGPTYPNRAYLQSAQSGGYKSNVLTLDTGGYQWETIWDRFTEAGVPAGYYYTDLPVLALWGGRLSEYFRLIDVYFDDAAAGNLPGVTFVDPGFLTDNRTDDHHPGDIRAGQRFLRDVFRAFAESPHWESGAFVITYDEWGGFYDHVPPPTLPDDRASDVDAENFGQAGFRVPTVLASPFAPRGLVDHHTYDHTSILRFLEWRFLGAPAEGPGRDTDTWFLTERDRHARNLAAVLQAEDPDPDVRIDLDVAIDAPSPPCGEEGAPAPAVSAKHAFEIAMDEGYFERVGHRVSPSPMAKMWAHG